MQKHGKFGKIPVPLTRTLVSKMRLLKTRSHTSERLGYEARKNAGSMARETTVENLPRAASVAGEGRDDEMRLKETVGV